MSTCVKHGTLKNRVFKMCLIGLGSDCFSRECCLPIATFSQSLYKLIEDMLIQLRTCGQSYHLGKTRTFLKPPEKELDPLRTRLRVK